MVERAVTVDIRRWTNRDEMIDALMPFLRQQEDANCILIGTLYAMQMAGRDIGTERIFLSAEKDGQICGVLMMTPPYGPTISHVSRPEAAHALATELYAHVQSIGEMVALPESVAAFAEAWEALSGEKAERVYTERLHRLDEIAFWPSVPGKMVEAQEEHLPLLTTWMEAFNQEALGKIAPRNAEAAIRNRMAGPPEVSGLRVWLDETGEPVTMAGYAGPTGKSMRIGPVYTPPNRRGFGYATALTAHLTRELLDRGLRSVLLFTDADYPQSNRIYQRIGYQPICDLAQYRFDSGGKEQATND